MTSSSPLAWAGLVLVPLSGKLVRPSELGRLVASQGPRSPSAAGLTGQGFPAAGTASVKVKCGDRRGTLRTGNRDGNHDGALRSPLTPWTSA